MSRSIPALLILALLLPWVAWAGSQKVGGVSFPGNGQMTVGSSGITGAPWAEHWSANEATVNVTNAATKGNFGGWQTLDMGTSTGEKVFDLHGMVGPGYNGGTITLDVWWESTVTTGDVVIGAKFELSDEATIIDSSGFAAERKTTKTVSGTTKQFNRTTITFTQAQADGLVANSGYRIRIRRDGDDAADNLAGSVFIVFVTLRG